MFQAIHGTCIVMLGIDEGVLVGADKRQGNTLSDKKTEEASKILQIGDDGLATGWGLAALRSEDGQESRVDMFRIISTAAGDRNFKFDGTGYRLIGSAWVQEMHDHLRRTPRHEWPPTPVCKYWFKSLFVYRTEKRIEADVATYDYRLQFPTPFIDGGVEGVMARFVTGGALLVEGDGSGMSRIESGMAEFPVLPETKQAWIDQIDARKITARMGARIIKDALYANHLYGEDHNGGKSVGPTCDIALISRNQGFRWYERDVVTSRDIA